MYVRKNAATLTDEEWSRFMTAVVTLKHSFAQGSTVSVYDQFVALHGAV
jgi:tyrosinase